MREQFEEEFKHTYAYEVISSKVSDPLSFCEISRDYKYTVVQAGWGAWQHRQSEIDDLKTQLTNMEQCYIGMKKISNEQSEIIRDHVAAREQLRRRIDYALLAINDPEAQLCRRAWLALEALRG